MSNEVPLASESQPLRILVADDVEAVRYTIVLDMADEGWIVDEAASFGEMHQKLGRNTYDIVVTDIWMPDGDGISAIKSLRSTHPEVCVFAISGGGPGLSLASAKSLAEVWGATQLFVKPFDVADLIGAIKRSRG